MSFKKVLSQPHVVRQFRSALSKGRLAHAYAFYGPEGVGKALFARELSKTLLCKKGGGGGGHNVVDGDACGKCKQCQTVDTGENPDLLWVTTEYKVIGIDAIQELARLASLKPFESRRRVFVIEEADKMSTAASNCLLKTLEEPPPGVVILLVTTSLLQLPRTIISRCQAVRFHPLKPDILKRLIAESFGIEGDGLEWLTRASCGSMGWAARLIDEEAVARRKRLLERLSSLHIEDNFSVSQEVLEWCPHTEEEGLEGRRSCLRIWLGIMLEYYRDVLICKVGSGEIGLFNNDAQDKIEAKTHRLPVEAITGIIDEIKYSLDGLRFNANINLLVENLFSRIARLEAGG